jgi:Stage III sporulation protein AC/AD protein family.
MTFVKVIGIALAGMILSVLLRKMREEYSVMITLALSIGLISAAIAMILPLIEYIRTLSENTGFDTYLDIMLKACAIGLLTTFAAEISRDAGESAIASKIEMVGKCALLMSALPVMKTLIEAAKGFIS